MHRRRTERDVEMIPLHVADALSSLPELPGGEIDFSANGGTEEFERSLVSLPNIDEMHAGGVAKVWSEVMRPPYMPLGTMGIVVSIDSQRNNNEE